MLDNRPRSTRIDWQDWQVAGQEGASWVRPGQRSRATAGLEDRDEVSGPSLSVVSRSRVGAAGSDILFGSGTREEGGKKTWRRREEDKKTRRQENDAEEVRGDKISGRKKKRKQSD